jgi:cytoskeletal protein RodZ
MLIKLIILLFIVFISGVCWIIKRYPFAANREAELLYKTKKEHKAQPVGGVL